MDLQKYLSCSPVIDADGYPSEEALSIIQEWPVMLAPETQIAFLRFVLGAFRQPCGSVRGAIGGDGSLWLRFATGGWSGCEDVIGALMNNHLFWSAYWQSSHRGGLFVFGGLPVPLNEIADLLSS